MRLGQAKRYLESFTVPALIRHFELPVSTRDEILFSPGIVVLMKLVSVIFTTISSSLVWETLLCSLHEKLFNLLPSIEGLGEPKLPTGVSISGQESLHGLHGTRSKLVTFKLFTMGSTGGL